MESTVMFCVNQSSAFLLLLITFSFHRIVEMSSSNDCRLSSSSTLTPHMRPQKVQLTSLGHTACEGAGTEAKSPAVWSSLLSTTHYADPNF